MKRPVSLSNEPKSAKIYNVKYLLVQELIIGIIEVCIAIETHTMTRTNIRRHLKKNSFTHLRKALACNLLI